VLSEQEGIVSEHGERGGDGPDFRVGLGFDVHPFSVDPARGLVLGGVELAGERGLEGHSDGDVLAHAVADALLGAAGLGDLGERFADTDPAWAGADSMVLLASVVEAVTAAGFRPLNVDCAVVLEAPRLAPHRRRIAERLADVVGCDVGVKAKRAEGMGALGRREGVACWAVALLEHR
jgi:2-C-methyl-D-erythritol 2,4-cyclodiphosphate synthase